MSLGTSISAIDSQGHGLRVTFEKRGDRWAHVIERVEGDQITRVLESIESDAADAWPVSPPFQELSREMLPDGREVLFLVGRAGTSHWSASVEAQLDPPRIVFDVACRHGQLPTQLGSEYCGTAENLAVESLTPNTCIERCSASLRATATLANAGLPKTTQWKYAIRRGSAF